MRSYTYIRRWLALVLAVATLGSGTVTVIAASSKPAATKATTPATTNNISGAVTQSYNADPSVQTGMIVKLKPKDPATVVPLENTEIKSLLGVVVPADNAAIVLTPEQSKQQQVLVSRSGHYTILVSNQNGPIKTGDYVTVSALAGIGMKADGGQEQVVGKAAGNFSGTANVIGSTELQDTLGRKNSVAIGRVPVDIAILHNPLFQKTADYVPGFLAKAAVTVANKPVSAARIYLGLVLIFVTTLITGNMLYSGVRSGMIAVGRNPLSKKSIIRSLIQTVIAGLIIFIAGMFAVYLLLKL